MKLYVIGNPIAHSKSPEIHNFWLTSMKLKYKYEKKLIYENEIEKFLVLLREKKVLGINVTLPYKTVILNYVDKVEKNVKKIGAVNTIYVSNNQLIGANTDGLGFAKSVKHDANFVLKGKKIFIFGSGGAARGIIFELINQQVSSITIRNRNYKKAIALAQSVYDNTKYRELKIEKWDSQTFKKKYDLIINTTSFGMKENEILNFDYSQAHTDTLFCDIIYNPQKTEFLKKAEKKKFKTLNGMGMLVRQAETSFCKWFKLKVSEKMILKTKEMLEES